MFLKINLSSLRFFLIQHNTRSSSYTKPSNLHSLLFEKHTPNFPTSIFTEKPKRHDTNSILKFIIQIPYILSICHSPSFVILSFIYSWSLKLMYTICLFDLSHRIAIWFDLHILSLIWNHSILIKLLFRLSHGWRSSLFSSNSILSHTAFGISHSPLYDGAITSVL